MGTSATETSGHTAGDRLYPMLSLAEGAHHDWDRVALMGEGSVAVG